MGRPNDPESGDWLDRIAAAARGGNRGSAAVEESFLRLLRFLLAETSDGVLVSEEGRIVHANAAAATILGVEDPRALVGTSLASLYDAKDRETLRQRHAALGPGFSAYRTVQLRPAGREMVPAELQEIGLELGGRRVVIGLYRASPRAVAPVACPRLQAGAGAARAEHHCLAGAVFDVFWEEDLATGSLRWSPEIDRLLGYEAGEFPRDRSGWWELVHPEDRQHVRRDRERHLLRGETYRTEYRLRRKDGAFDPFAETGHAVRDKSGQPVRMVGAVRAMADEHRMRQRLRQSTRLESIGELAGGIAHDFNNLLGGIMGHASLLLTKIGRDSPAHQPVATILRSAQQAARLTDRLLSFARGKTGGRQSFELNKVAAETLSLISTSKLANIRLVMDLAENLPPIHGDASEILQVILNLVLNAADAMPEGGEIRIGSGLADVTEKDARRIRGARPGRHLYIEVCDTGTGIAPEHAEKIFDPFFTTKPPGKGTGLGLAMVDRAVRNHGGFVEVKSCVGQGSRFRVFLPVEAPPAREAAPPPPAPASPPRRPRSTVLLVEPRAEARDAARAALTRAGHRVLAAEDNREARRLFLSVAGKIDLALLDFEPADDEAEQTYRMLRQVNPEVRIIVSARGGRSRAIDQVLGEGASAFLRKPCEPAEVLSLVSATLGREPHHA